LRLHSGLNVDHILRQDSSFIVAGFVSNFFAISLPVFNDTTPVESLPFFFLLGHWNPRSSFDAKLYSTSWKDPQTRQRICYFCRGMRIGGGESKSENAQ
jgi:hypothetical protein